MASSNWKNEYIGMYINNTLSGNLVNYSSTITSRQKLIIGARYNISDTQSAFFNGKISEFHIFRGNPKQTDFETKQMKYFEIT